MASQFRVQSILSEYDQRYDVICSIVAGSTGVVAREPSVHLHRVDRQFDRSSFFFANDFEYVIQTAEPNIRRDDHFSPMSVTATARSVIDVVQERNITFLAASFAYYAFVSVFPLALLALTVGTLIGGQEFANALVQQAQGLLSEQGASFLEQAVQNSSARTGASLLSVVVLLWSALKLFRGLLLAFEEVYQREPDASIVEQLKKGFVTLIAVAVGIALMIAVGAVIRSSAFEAIPFIDFAGTLTLLLGLVLVFLPLYYVLPPVSMTVREAIPGTLVAAFGWIILQAGFQAYAGAASKAPVYGALAGVILFLTWLYFAGILLLVGAAVNVVVAGRSAATVR